MLGNVWEWVNDWYDASYYSACSSGCTDPSGTFTGLFRVDRGGSWGNSARYVRAADRNAGDPRNRSGYVGFRLARSVR
jgi:formylglycine-generating enzyme required for sulfatase activity